MSLFQKFGYSISVVLTIVALIPAASYVSTFMSVQCLLLGAWVISLALGSRSLVATVCMVVFTLGAYGAIANWQLAESSWIGFLLVGALDICPALISAAILVKLNYLGAKDQGIEGSET